MMRVLVRKAPKGDEQLGLHHDIELLPHIAVLTMIHSNDGVLACQGLRAERGEVTSKEETQPAPLPHTQQHCDAI